MTLLSMEQAIFAHVSVLERVLRRALLRRNSAGVSFDNFGKKETDGHDVFDHFVGWQRFVPNNPVTQIMTMKTFFLRGVW